MYDPAIVAQHLYYSINVAGDTYILEQEIEGATFYLFYDSNVHYYYYTHPRWSTVGIGFTPLDAELYLIHEGQLIYDELKDDDLMDYTMEEMRMRDWAMRVSQYNIREQMIN